MSVYWRINTIWSKLNLKPIFHLPWKLWMSGSSWDQPIRPVGIFGIRKWPRHGRDAGNSFGGWSNERNLGLWRQRLRMTKKANWSYSVYLRGPSVPIALGTSLYISFNLPSKNFQSIFARYTRMVGACHRFISFQSVCSFFIGGFFDSFFWQLRYLFGGRHGHQRDGSPMASMATEGTRCGFRGAFGRLGICPSKMFGGVRWWIMVDDIFGGMEEDLPALFLGSLGLWSIFQPNVSSRILRTWNMRLVWMGEIHGTSKSLPKKAMISYLLAKLFQIVRLVQKRKLSLSFLWVRDLMELLWGIRKHNTLWSG